MRFEYADGRMPVSMTSSGNTYYLTYDQVGSLRVVSGSTGNLVKRVDYDSFGNIIGDSNPGFAVPFGFAGGLHDRDTGLVRFGFRDYDSDIGRWTAKDPIGFLGGDTDLYGYCLNNPVNDFDPYGLLEGVLPLPKPLPWWWPLPLPLLLPVLTHPVTVGVAAGAVVVLWPSETDLDPCEKLQKQCKAQWIADTQWCDNNFKGRKNIACHSWAQEEFYRCLAGQPRQPFRL